MSLLKLVGETSPPWASGVLCKECFAIFAFSTHSLLAKDSRAQRLKRKIMKKRNQWRVKEIEKGTFTPLVFTVQGGCGRECELEDLALKTHQRLLMLFFFFAKIERGGKSRVQGGNERQR